MSAIEKALQFVAEYHEKIKELNEKLNECSDRIEYLQLEIRMMTEKEIPDAQTKALIDGTDASYVNKLKKQLAKYKSELQELQEHQLILQNVNQ